MARCGQAPRPPVPGSGAALPATPVGEVDDDVRRLLERMTDVMMTSHGVGLAAPQIGVLRRVLVYRVSEDEGGARR